VVQPLGAVTLLRDTVIAKFFDRSLTRLPATPPIPLRAMCSIFENLETRTFDNGTQWVAEGFVPALAPYAESIQRLERSLTSLAY
jgi:hypothetical protein